MQVRGRRRRADEAAAAQVQSLRDMARSRRYEVAYVTWVYQHARRGAKAKIRVDSTGEVIDSWFEGTQWTHGLLAGQLLAVTGRISGGRHHGTPVCLYVDHVAGWVPPGVVARSNRHHSRTAGPSGGNTAPPSGRSTWSSVPGRYSTTAILALILAFTAAPLAVPVGRVALRQTRRTGARGAGMARVAILLGLVFTGLFLGLIAYNNAHPFPVTPHTK